MSLKCANCECGHDGRTPGFEPGDCDCHRIGGPYISQMSHEPDLRCFCDCHCAADGGPVDGLYCLNCAYDHDFDPSTPLV